MMTQSEAEELLFACAAALLEGERFTPTCGGGAVASCEGVLGQPGTRPLEIASLGVLAAQHLPHTTVQIIVDGIFLGKMDIWMGLGFSVADDGTGNMTDELRKATRDAARVIAAEICE